MVYLLIAGIAIAIIGAGIGTWQAVEARQRQEEEANKIAEEKVKESKIVKDNAAYAEQQHRRRIALLAGKQAAVTAAAGVSLTNGSPLVAEIDLAEQGEMEALTLKRGGQIESNARLFEARLAKFRGDTARGQIPYDIATGALTAASGATSSYSSYNYYNSGYGNRKRTFTSNDYV